MSIVILQLPEVKFNDLNAQGIAHIVGARPFKDGEGQRNECETYGWKKCGYIGIAAVDVDGHFGIIQKEWVEPIRRNGCKH